ncbi:MAG: retention module-containing protein, partial [Bacteroidota bacterium]
MAQTQVIAKVSSINGEAFARDASGKLHQLKVGDSIREGETVVAADGSQILLTLVDGREITVRPGEIARIDAEVGALVKPDASDSAVVNHEQGFQKIAKAIATGGNLDNLLDQDAPAAGALGQGGNEGHTFVEFARIVETVTPLAFQYGTERGAPVDTIQSAPILNLANAAPTIGSIVPGAPTPTDDNVNEGVNLVYTVSVNGTSLTPTTFAFSLG